ncbi:MAG: hypothetical protein MK171_04770 [Pirellulales bacterium]|nr:hypothetical protein [Pirellulales bacterium]
MKPSQLHFPSAIVFSALVLIVVGASGCRGPLSAVLIRQSEPTARPEPQEGPTTARPDKQPDPGTGSTLASHEEAMVDVLEIEPIDSATKEALLDDLRAAKPEDWLVVVRQFQAGLAYRQQLAAKERKAPEDRVEPDLPAVEALRSGPMAEAASAHLALCEPAVVGLGQQSHQAVAVVEGPIQAEQAGYVTPITHPANWQEHLDLAIAGLEESTQLIPGTTDELQAHMRLRLLKQLAGQEEGAMLPISGAPPGLQDYWAEQISTIATFFDNRRQPDDKRRAAGSLVHLDQARAELAELATLEVRNLAFVDSVGGYGVYEQCKTPQFLPGEHVSLYGEVENFCSTLSKEEGYCTKISSSYEVVDLHGQRVDGREFPDVEDCCQRLRRDFHMQFGIDLPTRIYPGEYQLRVIITDGMSHKIGQASVPFEIVE